MRALLVVLVLVLLSAAYGTRSQPVERTPISRAAEQAAQLPADTPEPTDTPLPTPTATVTETPTPTPSNPEPGGKLYEVVKVVDADTVKIERDGRVETLRLTRMDIA